MLSKKMIKKDPDNPWLKRRKELIQYYAETLKDYPKEITARKSLKKLRELLPANAIVTTEVGQCQMWTSLHFDVITRSSARPALARWALGFQLQ
jgi:acetolactate synthase-1/2/3 large subunit